MIKASRYARRSRGTANGDRDGDRVAPETAAVPLSRPRLLARLARLARNNRATTTVEFAIIGPIMLLLLLAVVENGMALFSQSVLDNATRDAARLSLTGQSQNGGTSFATQLCNEISGYLSCANLSYRIQTGSTFSSLSPNITTGTGGVLTGFSTYPSSVTGGNSGDFVLVQVVYKRNYIVPWVGKLLSANGADQIITTAAFENEPF